jgi:uncharacterized protein YdaU (DUF1376 family)
MNFYSFHIGDYASATRHLSWDEDMAYRRLLDAYYSREQPLSLDRRQVYRLVGAADKRQREAVDTALVEFFDEHPDGWRNARADEEIAKALIKKEKAKQSAAMRWGSHPHSEGYANASPTAMRSHSEGNAPNPNPNPNPKSIGEVVARARDPDAELERKLREAAGWQSEPAPMLAVTGEVQALIDNGADLEADVLPVVKALAPQAGSRSSWRYFLSAIAKQRDQRIAAATVISMPTTTARISSHAATRKKPSRAETFDAIRRRIDEIAVAEADDGTASAGHGGSGDPAEGAA